MRKQRPKPVIRKLPVAVMARSKRRKLPWVIDGMITEGSVTLLVAAGGSGKSFFLMGAGRAVAVGAPFLGRQTKKGKVIYLDAEMGYRQLQRRIHMLDLGTTIDFRQITRLDLSTAEGADLVERIVAQEKPRMLVIDSYVRVIGGKEDGDPDVAYAVLDRLTAMARKHRTAVIVIHHTQRNTGKFRGTGVLRDQSDATLTIRSFRGKAERSLDCNEKFREDEQWPPIWFIFNQPDDDHMVVEAVKEPMWAYPVFGDPNDPWPDPMPMESVRDTVAESVLAVLRGGDKLRLADVARSIGKDPKVATVRRALRDLEKRGLVEREATGEKRYSTEVTNVIPITQGFKRPE